MTATVDAPETSPSGDDKSKGGSIGNLVVIALAAIIVAVVALIGAVAVTAIVTGDKGAYLQIVFGALRRSEDDLARGLRLATTIAAQSPHAIRHAKSLVNQFGRVDTATAFANERRYMAELIGSPNQVEAVGAYFEKRPAVYTDPS